LTDSKWREQCVPGRPFVAHPAFPTAQHSAP